MAQRLSDAQQGWLKSQIGCLDLFPDKATTNYAVLNRVLASIVADYFQRWPVWYESDDTWLLEMEVWEVEKVWFKSACLKPT